jgi:hypothetical protein
MKAAQQLLIAYVLVNTFAIHAQHEGHHTSNNATVTGVEAQPLLAQAIRLQEALSFLGSALPGEDIAQLKSLQHKELNSETVKRVQEILDPYCLAIININPEARVKVARGLAKAKLMQGGWTSFLVKVNNDAGVTAKLEVESPNAAPALHISTSEPRVTPENILSPGQVANRFLEMSMYRNPPLQPNLSGLKLEYAVLQIYSKDAGQREAEIGFNIGQGSQDIGFRNTIAVLFNVSKPVKVVLRINDDDGLPTMASLTFTDGVERILDEQSKEKSRPDYRTTKARQEYQLLAKELKGVYPLPSRRVAEYDEFPDFFFQPQVYRKDGEHVMLPPGKYNVMFTRGPEYILQSKEITVPSGVESFEVSFQLKRWIDMAKLGWYSADHHVHGAGCSHYESPQEGVPPAHMWRQMLGEDLNVAASLAWGPSWYHQKTFFTGKDEPFSTKKNIMRNDVEVSGFPSSHAGHVVLLRIKEDDYPGTTKIEDWPSWTLPVLTWAKSQGGVVGYAHSGWGLEPMIPTNDLPNYVLPKMDGIGANEYIVTVTQNVVDFFSLGDTPAPWELNMWYHVLNSGFKTRLSGETDFPCVYDERVGLARSYFKTDGPMSYDNYVDALKKGRGYVSDGGSHISHFSANGVEVGTNNSELSIKSPQTLKIKATVAAYLNPQQDERGAAIAQRRLTEQPYWHIERARIATSQKVKVELIMNGKPVASSDVTADGKLNDVTFSHNIDQSGWLAVRVYPSSHTNPIFASVAGKPVQEKQSAEWCRQAVDQCWKMKESNIRDTEKSDARTAYDKARSVYDKIIREASAK